MPKIHPILAEANALQDAGRYVHTTFPHQAYGDLRKENSELAIKDTVRVADLVPSQLDGYRTLAIDRALQASNLRTGWHYPVRSWRGMALETSVYGVIGLYCLGRASFSAFEKIIVAEKSDVSIMAEAMTPCLGTKFAQAIKKETENKDPKTEIKNEANVIEKPSSPGVPQAMLSQIDLPTMRQAFIECTPIDPAYVREQKIQNAHDKMEGSLMLAVAAIIAGAIHLGNHFRVRALYTKMEAAMKIEQRNRGLIEERQAKEALSPRAV